MNSYRYLIYRLLTWGKGDTPVANVIITLTIVHFIQLFSFYLILLKIFPQLNVLDRINWLLLGIGLIIFGIIHYFIFYNKRKWNLYLEEFKNESPSKRKKGKILVLSYLIGSFVIFFMLLPILYGF
jgi:hypothetical protein